jgi:oxygen-dependent protoporphyrinogen oxidase
MNPLARRSPDALDVLVIGGGISGLTAAFHLKRSGLEVAVLEATARVGGAIETHTAGTWRFELGPNTVLESEPELGKLIAQAGLAEAKILARPTARRRYIYKDGHLHALPGGPGGFLRTPLFPWSAKLGLLREPWISRPQGDPEESIAAFVRRRLGPAFLDNAVGPFVSGIYAGDPERLSARWALPRIAALEREHGSLLRGAFARRKEPAAGAEPRGSGAMLSFGAGLEELPRRLASEIGDVRLGVAAKSIARTERGFRVETADGPVLAERILLAVPADVAARLLDEVTGGRSRAFAEIPYGPVAVVALGYRRDEITHPLGGFGYLAVKEPGRHILGCLFPSEIFPDRAPAGHVALSAFVGGRTDPEVVSWDEDRIAETVTTEVGQTLGIRGQPAFRLVRRWPRAIPQYEVGHGRFVELGEEIERELPGLRLGGNFLRGISVPDCIRNGALLAEKLRLMPGWA